MQRPKRANILLAVIAFAAWAAPIAQFCINVTNRQVALPETIVRFFSYFTIDTNFIVAVCSTFILLAPASAVGKFFSKAATQAAIAIYILVVGVIYNTMLRFLWAPQGLQRAVDETLHLLVPVLFVLYWYFFAPKQLLRWNNILPWLLYPFLYAVLVMIRGSMAEVHFYPYPFLDVDLLGWPRTIINALGVTAVFLVASVLCVAVAKPMSRPK